MIGIEDMGAKLPNLALMKISTYHKAMGEQVEFIRPGGKYDKVYISTIFSWDRPKVERLLEQYPDAEVGGTGWDLTKELPEEIERCRPDYDLYTADRIYQRISRGIGLKESKQRKAQTIADAGIGFTSRGCIRKCGFCVVPRKEGGLRQVASIGDLINPRSNVLILHDNNLTADPLALDKLREIRDRGLIVDINQGCDVRLMTDELAHALSEVRHLHALHYAWDLIGFEAQVLRGIETLSRHVKRWRQMCFVLVGYNTEFDEDMYRVKRLHDLGVSPYVMIYNLQGDRRLKHFARWVNGRIYKAVSDFKDYIPWVREQEAMP